MGVRLNGLILSVIPRGPPPISQIRCGVIVFLSRLLLHCTHIFPPVFSVRPLRDPSVLLFLSCHGFLSGLVFLFLKKKKAVNRRLNSHLLNSHIRLLR